MATRGMIYEHWMALTPSEQWQSFRELEDALHRLQDKRAREVKVILSMDESHVRQLFRNMLGEISEAT